MAENKNKLRELLQNLLDGNFPARPETVTVNGISVTVLPDGGIQLTQGSQVLELLPAV